MNRRKMALFDYSLTSSGKSPAKDRFIEYGTPWCESLSRKSSGPRVERGQLLGFPIMKLLIHSSLDSFLGRICIDLDDFDSIVGLLRRNCRSVQIVAHDVLIEDSSQFQELGDRPVRDLEIEAYDPFLRIRFQGTGHRYKPKWRTGSDVASDPDDSVVSALRAQIEAILKGARRQGSISILAGFTGNERRSTRIVGLIVGLILTLFMVVPLLFPDARPLAIALGACTLSMTLPVAVMTILLPWAPVLLLQRGRVRDRTKLEPKPDLISEL
jgi:hypothetical protein